MEEEITESAGYKAAVVYEQFFVGGIFKYWTPILLASVALQPGEEALDVACGTGVVARSAAPLVGPQGRVVGVDFNPAMLQVACRQFSEHCDEVEWREGRAENLPLPDESFDVVLCQQGLQFFSDRPKAAREMRRVLHKNGRVGIEVWRSLVDNPFYLTIFEAVAAVFGVLMSDLAAAFSYGEADALEGLLAGAGFREVQVQTVEQPVFFREPERFIELTIRAAGAVLPAFARLDRTMQAELLAKVNGEMAGFIGDHTRDGVLSFPMRGNLATGMR